MELNKEERQDLMRRYGIPTTGFFWRLKKANNKEDLLDLLEKYKQMAIKRERRKLEKELSLLKSGKSTDIKIPENPKSKDEYQMLIYKEVERAARAAIVRYPSVKLDVLCSHEDIVQDMAFQMLRSSKDRDLTEYRDYMVSYETGEEILYAIRRNGKIYKDKGVTVVENIKHSIKEPTIEERYKKIDLMFSGWYPVTKKYIVCVDKHEKQFLVADEDLASAKSNGLTPFRVPGIDLYTKYIKGIVKIENTRSFVNQAVNNYFKDNIAKKANAPHISSLDVPLGGSNTENTLTLADVLPDYDDNNLYINEAIEHCEGVMYKGIDLGDIFKEIIYNHTALNKICKRYGLQTKAVMAQFDKLKIREILG